MAVELIKINEFPDSGALSDTDFLVIGLPDGTGAKIDIASARAFLGVSVVEGIAEQSTDPGTPTVGETYFAGAGTFTNFLDSGGQPITTTENLNALTYNGTFWDVLPIPIGVDLSGYATQAEFEDVENKLDNVLIAGSNKVDPGTFQAGGYSSASGNLADSVNQISTTRFPVPAAWIGQQFTLSGMGIISGSYGRVVIRDNTDTNVQIIPGDSTNNPVTFTFPAGSATVAFTIAAGIDVGLDPQNSPYKDTLMFNQGATALPFEAYGAKVDATKIEGLEPVVEQLPVVTGLEDDVSGLTTSVAEILDTYNVFGIYDGTGSTALPETYQLQNIGDYVELHLRLRDDFSGFADGLGLLGVGITSATNVFGFNSATQVWLRGNNSGEAYIQWNNIDSNLFEFVTLRLEVNGSDEWELFINGDSLGAMARTSDLHINTIANAYTSNAKVDIIDFTIHTSTQDLSIGNMATYAGSTDVTQGLQLKQQNSAGDAFPKGFYEFDPTGQAGQPKFTIYVKREGSDNEYIGFIVAKELDMDPLIYQDYWRLITASDFTYNGDTMAPNGSATLASGENEFVWRQINKADFTGGYHGDELVTDFRAYPDGVEIPDLTNAIPLTPCDYFYYAEKSTMHETANAATPNQPIPGHPIVAYHTKITRFEASGYETFNTIIFNAALEIDILYVFLCCNAKSQATSGHDEYLNRADFVSADNSNKLQSDIAAEFFGTGSSRSSHMNSELIQPEAMKPNVKYFITDRIADTKYYRPVENQTVAVNDLWVCKGNAKFRSSQ